MKHDLTQPVVDLTQQCRRCGEKWSIVVAILAKQPGNICPNPEESECAGFSLKHWWWRKRQNMRVKVNAIMWYLHTGRNVVSYRDMRNFMREHIVKY